MIKYPIYCPICKNELSIEDKVTIQYKCSELDERISTPYTIGVVPIGIDTSNPCKKPHTFFQCHHIKEDGSLCNSIFAIIDSDLK